MKQIASVTLGLALAMLMLASGAHAQIDSPPPPLMGEPSFHLYSDHEGWPLHWHWNCYWIVARQLGVPTREQQNHRIARIVREDLMHRRTT